MGNMGGRLLWPLQPYATSDDWLEHQIGLMNMYWLSHTIPYLPLQLGVLFDKTRLKRGEQQRNTRGKPYHPVDDWRSDVVLSQLGHAKIKLSDFLAVVKTRGILWAFISASSGASVCPRLTPGCCCK